MNSDDSRPETGTDDSNDDEYPPMVEADDEALAMALEDEKQSARFAVDALTRSLLNEDVPLRGEEVEDLHDAASRLTALCDALVQRQDESVEAMG